MHSLDARRQISFHMDGNDGLDRVEDFAEWKPPGGVAGRW
jgi:hypothetical protein